MTYIESIIFENMVCYKAHNVITKHAPELGHGEPVRLRGICVTPVELTVLQSEQLLCLMNMQGEGYEYSLLAATLHSYCEKQCVWKENYYFFLLLYLSIQ